MMQGGQVFRLCPFGDECCLGLIIGTHSCGQRSRLKSSMPSKVIWPFKIYLSQNKPFKTQPQIENEDVT